VSGMATEIVCAECGTTNQAGEDFCGECGAYLEWDGRTVEPEPEPEPAPAPVVEEAPRTVVDRVKAAVGIGTDDETSAEQEKPPETPAEPAAQKTAAPVAAVLPGAAAPKARKRTAAPLDQPLQPGDLVCGSCGAGNSPSRKFCRRCGHDLAEAEVAKIPWWRRILPKRGPRTKVAGTRPRQRRRSRLPSYARVVVVLALVAGVVYLTKPLWSPAGEYVMDRVKGTVKVQPVKYTASSSAPGHAPRRVHDGHPNRYWAPAEPGHARREYVEVTFSGPVRLVYVNISLGASDKEARFLRNGRPTKIRATVFDSQGGADNLNTWTMDDAVGFQLRGVHRSDVTRLRLMIIQSHLGDRPRSHVAIGEVDFEARK
jgi:ribosomal protein L40E